MTRPEQVIVVYCTVPDLETGRRIAAHLVEYRLAACVNLLPGIESVYRWNDAVQNDAEVLLMIKSTTADYPELEAAIRGQHPYELPEIIAVSLTNGHPGYLDWVVKQNEAP
jgi:periplasmic divalent cation tolerance protein